MKNDEQKNLNPDQKLIKENRMSELTDIFCDVFQQSQTFGNKFNPFAGNYKHVEIEHTKNKYIYKHIHSVLEQVIFCTQYFDDTCRLGTSWSIYVDTNNIILNGYLYKNNQTYFITSDNKRVQFIIDIKQKTLATNSIEDAKFVREHIHLIYNTNDINKWILYPHNVLDKFIPPELSNIIIDYSY